MEGILVPLGMFAVLPVIIWIVVGSRHKERMEMIRQGINPGPSKMKISVGTGVLLWGMIFAALGLAGLIFYIVMGEVNDPEKLFFAISSLVLGGALFAYYRMTAPQRKKAQDLMERYMESMAEQNRAAAPEQARQRENAQI